MENSLTVVEQKEITFYDDELIAIRANDGQIYVSVRHMCDALGLNVQAQSRRAKRHKILSSGLMVAKMATIKGLRNANVLRADLITLWLTGVNTSSVKEEIRPKIETFQLEAAKVLWEAFQEGRLTADPTFDDLLQIDSPAVQAYKTLQALTKIARSQIILEGRMDEHERRLEQIEATLGDPGQNVTPDQASQVSQAVKGVAISLGKQTKRNEFGAVYGEMYRKFGVTSYKLLPANKFQTCMDWLTEWHQSLVDNVAF